MFTTICLLVLAYMFMGKPVDELVEKVKNVDWSAKFEELKSKIKIYSCKAGRIAAKPVLTFYYAMTMSDLSLVDKILIYGVILYIVIPNDLIPRRTFRWLGVLDDAAVAAFTYNKIQGLITPEIEAKVQETIDEWFGAEYATIVE